MAARSSRAVAFKLLASLVLFTIFANVNASPCAAGNANTDGCQCSGSITESQCAALWFSCRQTGSGSVNNIGLAFTYGQPQRTDPGYRWYIANGPSNTPYWAGQTTGFTSGSAPTIVPFLPYAKSSIPKGSPTFPQWTSGGVATLSSAAPVNTNGWACTADGLLDRSLNGGNGPTQPYCQYGSQSPIPVTTSPTCTICCPPQKIFDGFSNSQGSGWQLASIAVTTSAGTTEYPAAAIRVQTAGAGIGTVPRDDLNAGSGLKVAELRRIASFSLSDVTMDCFISLFNPCKTCPTSVTDGGSTLPINNYKTPGCCAASTETFINSACCPTVQVITTPTLACCPAGSVAISSKDNCCPPAPSGGSYVICTGDETNCVTGTPDKCCLASQWNTQTKTCCPASAPPVRLSNGTIVCCTTRAPDGSCCSPTQTNSDIIDNLCCPLSQIITVSGGVRHCCLNCPTSGSACPSSGLSAYTWLSAQTCCLTALLSTDSSVCCPSCIGSNPATFTGSDRRKSGDCGNGSPKCCPSGQLVKQVATPTTFDCCPAATTIDSWFSGATTPNTPYTGVWYVTPFSEGGGARCCPLSNIKCVGTLDSVDTTSPSTGALAKSEAICCKSSLAHCTSTSFKCCAPAEWIKYGGKDGCCGAPGAMVNRGLPAGNGQDIGAIGGIYLGEGNCCPTAFITNQPGVPTNLDCCYNAQGNPANGYVWTPACPKCTGAPAERHCCDKDLVEYDPPNTPVACCPTAAASTTTTIARDGSGAKDYCCPSTSVTAGNSNTGTAGLNFCCGNPGSSYTIIGGPYPNSGVQCCLTNRVPTNPATGALDYSLCCTSSPGTSTWYSINGACCLSSNAVRDNTNTWRCCPNTNAPIYFNNRCCAAGSTLNDTNGAPVFCCPNTITAGQRACNNVPPSGSCYVYDAMPGPGGNYKVAGTGGNCCPADRITYDSSPAPTITSQYTCCPNTGRVWTPQDACCAANRVPAKYDEVVRTTRPLLRTGEPFCCPVAVVSTITYTQTTYTTDSSNYPLDCCPATNVNVDPATGATITDPARSWCCPSPGSVAVNEVSNQASSSYLNCCPAANVLQNGTTYYCCPNKKNPGDIWFVSSDGTKSCCAGANVISNPANSAQKICCPTTGLTWADEFPTSTAPGCCDARFALPNTQFGIFCCPLNTPGAPTGGIPGAPSGPATTPAWALYKRVPTSSVTGSGWNSINWQCCDPRNVQVNRIVDAAGNNVSICCPAPGLTYIIGDATHPPGCCPGGTIRYDVAGDLTKATCCPISTPITGTSRATGLPTCCTDADYQSVDKVCCDRPNDPNNPVSTINEVCCPQGDTLSLNTWNPPYFNYTGQNICCPKVSGKPGPFLDPFVDPKNPIPRCCYGYNTTVPPRACCVKATDFNTVDDACCETVADSTGNCCPVTRWIPGANGAPQTGTCCLASETIVTNTTSNAVSCCPLALADVQRTSCCLPPFVLDGIGNCCPAAQLNTDPITGVQSCCLPAARDSFGVCCASDQILHVGGVLNGVGNSTLKVCCYNNTIDCAGLCYWQDPTSGSVTPVPLNTADANGRCCPNQPRDCAQLCPLSDGSFINYQHTNRSDDCCPDTSRDCSGVCGGRDKNCCENQPTPLDTCTKCQQKQGCGWCAVPFSSAGTCYSGNYFGAYTGGAAESPCNSSANRWVMNPPSAIITKNGTFQDGWNIEYKNYTVTLSPNDPLNVTFAVKVPANVPLDLYILQDGTASFGTQLAGQPSSLQNFQLILPSLINQILANVTSDLLLGFGTFADKAVEPFGYWSGSTLDYLFLNRGGVMTTSYNTIVSAVNALTNADLRGGADIPEGTLDALVDLGLSSSIGWRISNAITYNHVALVVTDAPPHIASLGTANFTFGSSGPFDLQWWLDPSAPAQTGQFVNNARPSPSAPAWVPNDGTGSLDQGCVNRPGAATITPSYQRQGLCMDYPSYNQTITALRTKDIVPVFVVADTVGPDPTGTDYPITAGFDAWVNFLADYAVAENVPVGSIGLVTKLAGVGTPSGAETLLNTILNALYQITQTVSLREYNSSSPYVTGIDPAQYDTARPGQILNFTVSLFWNGTYPGNDGPFPVDVIALFPKTNYPIDFGHIDIYLSDKKYCGWCGDLIITPEIGEECEPDLQAPADQACCTSDCYIATDALCNDISRCNPVFCNASGICVEEPVTCTPIVDPVLSTCSYNSCISGSCVVSCFGSNVSNPCCDDNNTCTIDTCQSGVCRHDLILECDCGANPAFNNCFACVANNITTCGWRTDTGSCVNINITDLILHPEDYGLDPTKNETWIVRNNEEAEERCATAGVPGSKVGLIVGVIAGAAALAALIALAAVFWHRIREIAQRIFGDVGHSTSAASAVVDNPTYSPQGHQQSPIYT